MKHLLISSAAIYLLATTNLIAQESPNILKEYTKEVGRLINNKSVKEAFQYIDELETKTIDDLITLTEIPAPPFGEEKRALKFKDMLEQAGTDSVWIDKEGNVIGLYKGTDGRKTVTLDAHIDTVFPIETDVKVKKRGDTLFAPGIGDDTRGMVMVLTTLRAMYKTKIKPKSDILFIGTVGEEGLGDLRGVKHLFSDKSSVKIDSWISIDGGSLGRVNNGALGSICYKAIFSGPGGHSWGAFGLANPHHALGKAIDKFTQVASRFTDKGPKTSFNIGRIGGGTSVNSIPFESWFEVDMRSLDRSRLMKIDSMFKSTITAAVEEYNQSGIKQEIEVTFQKIGDRPSGVQSTTIPLIQRALAATRKFGSQPKLTTGSTNSNIPIAKGIPAITIGRGGKGGKAHSLGEWWMNKDGAKSIKLTLLILLLEANGDL